VVSTLLDKLQAIEDKYDQLSELLSDPGVISNQTEWQKHAKAQAKLTGLVGKFRQYKQVLKGLGDSREMLKEKLDPDMKELVQTEFEDLKGQEERIAEELRVLLLPKDPNDDKNVIVEIRGGAGGDEAALFAADLLRMYTRYAERNGWRTEIMEASSTDIGGFKEAIFLIEGDGAFSRLKYESGVHRVQRVPDTEASGRIHTSTVTVAVLPEAEEVDVEINSNDLRIDTFCAGGAGGQHVNKTESAVRITHIPTGIVVQCQDEKSQMKNRDKAMRVLRARVLEQAQAAAHAELAGVRKSQVGTGDRSERIRTYNFPQGRVTDHRVGVTLHKLDMVLEGDLDDIINVLINTAQAEKLKEAE
jgi:peptide chain release factor 1